MTAMVPPTPIGHAGARLQWFAANIVTFENFNERLSPIRAHYGVGEIGGIDLPFDRAVFEIPGDRASPTVGHL